jgi:hypothetical protein
MQEITSRFVTVSIARGERQWTVNLATIASIDVCAMQNSASVTLTTGETVRGTLAEMCTLMQAVGAPVLPGVLSRSIESAIKEVERPYYLEREPWNRAGYVEGLRLMFGACRDAHLNTNDRDGMLRAIGELLGWTVSSRQQLTPGEMERIASAARRGYWNRDWTVRTDARGMVIVLL